MKRFKKILLILILVAFAVAFYSFYLYNLKPADVRKQAANYELTAAALLAGYNEDEAAANLKYLDKVISVKGKITEIKLDETNRQATVILDSGDPMVAVTCSFYSEEAGNVKKINLGDEVTIKGKCIGKLMDVVLNKCSIVK